MLKNKLQKPLQYCKVISLQLTKINGKNNLKNNKLQNQFYVSGDDDGECSVASDSLGSHRL